MASNFESEFSSLLSTLPSSSSDGAVGSTSASANLLRTKALRDNGSLTLSIAPLSPQVKSSVDESKVSLPTEAELRARGELKLRKSGVGLLGSGIFGGVGGVGDGGMGMKTKGKGKGKGRMKVVKRSQKEIKKKHKPRKK